MNKTRHAALLVFALSCTSCGGGGGNDSPVAPIAPTPPPSEVDFERLASSLQVLVATHVAGVVSGAQETVDWSSPRIGGETRPCAIGGSVTIEGAAPPGAAFAGRYRFSGCALAIEPLLSINGAAPVDNDDVSNVGGFVAQGQVLGRDVRITIPTGTITGNAKPQSEGGDTYALRQYLSAGGGFTVGAQSRYATSDASLSGTKVGSTVTVDQFAAMFQYGGRSLHAVTESPLVWNVTGPTNGALVISNQESTQALKYTFDPAGSVTVTIPGTNALVGHFAYSGPEFQEALAAATR